MSSISQAWRQLAHGSFDRMRGSCRSCGALAWAAGLYLEQFCVGGVSSCGALGRGAALEGTFTDQLVTSLPVFKFERR